MKTPDVIRNARIAQHLSQADLARVVGVDTRQINRYETGVTEPGLTVARKLAERLQITMDELAGADTPFTGTWWSAWHGITGDQILTGPVELALRGNRVIIQPVSLTAHEDERTEIEISWRAEMILDVDVLLGWYTVETPGLRARGTLHLAHRNDAIDGNWIGFSLRGPKSGQVALDRNAPGARDRLQQVLRTVAEQKQNNP